MPTPRKSHAEICEAAEKLDSEEAKKAFVAEECGDDADLRHRVEEHVFAPEPPHDFMRPAAALPDSEKPGDRIGNYKLLQQIGEGGCGVVFMAEQEQPIRRRVALKVIKLGMDTKAVIARFEAERQALAMMDHPNIAKVLDAGATERGRPFFVMELVRGLRITDYCDENHLSSEARLDLLIKVCHAVQHAHQKGIIHRDLKPSNILVTVNDGEPVPKVIDFGIAKATAGQKLAGKTVFTAFEQFIGTPDYMSPEQAGMTSLDIDTRSDIYSLGVLHYELLTGKTPLNLKELGLDEMRRTIREREPVRPSTRLRSMAQAEQTTTATRRRATTQRLINLLSGDLDWVVMKCLEKDRGRRYSTANELAEDLQHFLRHEPVHARPPSPLYRLRKLVRRKPALVATVAACLLTAGAMVAVWFQHQKAVAETKLAVERAQLAEAKVQLAAEEARRESEWARGRESLRTNDSLIAQRIAGWSEAVISNCVNAKLPFTPELLTQAARGLAGMDATRLYNFPDVPGSSAAFSPDGRAVVACDGTNALLIAPNGAAERLPVRDTGPVAWTPEGEPLQLVARTNSVEVIEMRSGRVRRAFLILPNERIIGSRHPVLAITPEGNRVAAALFSIQASRVVVWDAATGAMIGETTQGGTALAFTPDAALIAVGKPDGKVVVHSVPGMKEVSRLSEGVRRGAVLALAFGRDRLVRDDDSGQENRWLLAAATGGQVGIWDVESQVRRSTCVGAMDAVLSLAFDPETMTTLAVAGRNNARVFDVMTGQPLLTLTGQGGDAARALAFNGDGSRLLWGVAAEHQSASVSIWQIDQGLGRGIAVLRGLGPNPRRIWFSPDSRRLAALDNDWLLGCWDLETGKLLWLWEAPQGNSSDNAGGAFDVRNESFVFAAGRTARRYDLSSRKILDRWNLNNGLCDDVQFDEGGRILLVRREGREGHRSLRFWRLLELGPGGGVMPIHEQQDTNWISYLTVLPAGAKRFIVANGGYGTRPLRKMVKVFDTASGKELISFTPDLDKMDTAVLADPSGNRFAYIADSTGRNQIVNLADRTFAGEAPSLNLGAVTGQFARGTGRGFVVEGPIYNSGGAVLGIDWQAVYFPLFSPDGKKLASGTQEGAVLVANLEEVKLRMDQLEREVK